DVAPSLQSGNHVVFRTVRTARCLPMSRTAITPGAILADLRWVPPWLWVHRERVARPRRSSRSSSGGVVASSDVTAPLRPRHTMRYHSSSGLAWIASASTWVADKRVGIHIAGAPEIARDGKRSRSALEGR